MDGSSVVGRAWALLFAGAVACAPPDEFSDGLETDGETDGRVGAVGSSSSTGSGSGSGSSSGSGSGSGTTSGSGTSSTSSTSSTSGTSSTSTTGGDDCTSAEDCNDSNECTEDSCGANGECQNVPVADDTGCDSDGDLCTKDVCIGGACEHPDEDDGFTCEDEPDGTTEDKCCSGGCEHYATEAISETYADVLLDPQYGDTDGDGDIDDDDQCVLATMSATLAGPGEGGMADEAEYTLTVTMEFNPPSTDPQVAGKCVSTSAAALAEAVAQAFPEMEYDPATQVLTIEKSGMSACGGGVVDLSLNYSGPNVAGNTLSLTATVDVGADDCCFVESVGPTLGSFSFSGP